LNFYLGQPGNQMQAVYLEDMPVCVSFANYSKWMDDYAPSWSRVLVDSGAYSELNTGKVIDLAEYREWAQQWGERPDAIAALDDISGEHERTIRNVEAMPEGIGFPTIHDTDPPDILPDLIDLARLHGNWLGIGLLPPRNSGVTFIRWVCDNVPDDLHIHGWALGAYAHIKRLDSVDSTNWFMDSWKVKKAVPWLTPAECCEVVIKRYKRWERPLGEPYHLALFEDVR